MYLQPTQDTWRFLIPDVEGMHAHFLKAIKEESMNIVFSHFWGCHGLGHGHDFLNSQ